MIDYTADNDKQHKCGSRSNKSKDATHWICKNKYFSFKQTIQSFQISYFPNSAKANNVNIFWVAASVLV